MSHAYFCVFWAEKNAERKAQGLPELNFREARKQFGFHVPPPGSVTLCSRGEDIRAFPDKTLEGRDMVRPVSASEREGRSLAHDQRYQQETHLLRQRERGARTAQLTRDCGGVACR
jgi:hypothetical protein